MTEPRPHDKSVCRNCETSIEWASERPEEGWEYGWYHLPVITGRRTGSRRCPIYAEPTGACLRRADRRMIISEINHICQNYDCPTRWDDDAPCSEDSPT